MEFFDNLNDQQQKAVAAGNGPVLVLAGPGSGKTRVLTQRAAYLIAHEGVRPYHILAVTFTNKAAREMQTRLEKLLGAEGTQGIMLGTFHAICARLLRREAGLLPIQSNFVIFDSDDQERMVKAVIRDLNLNEKLYRPASIHASISNAKNELILADDYPTTNYRHEVVKRVYVEYQRRLVASNAVDFDDLLVYTAHLLEDDPAVREKYARRFEHVLVDEFQDTNLAQYALIRHLASVHRNVFCVGDPDQSIYKWRGADWRNIQRFEQDFPEAQVILLEQNYRSRQNILEAAMGVIDRAPNRRQKRLFSDRGPGEKVFYYEAPDDYAEASFVVDTVSQLVAAGEFEPRDCAVMYRTNAQSRLLEEAFLQARLPYRLVGAQRFYGRREVKDVIAFLRLVHNPADEVSLDRVLNVPPRGIGEKTLLTLHTVSRQTGTPAGRILTDLARGSDSPYWKQFAGRSVIPLADFGGALAQWTAAAPGLTVVVLFDRILDDLNYKAYIDDESEEGVDRWENVQELRRLALEFSDRSLDDFLEDVALVADQDMIKEGINAPTLLTLHAAKGLEFGAVFITGLDDGILPHSRSFDEPEEMEEERRLFYVGITRAKDRLYLLRAVQRGGRGYAEETYPSRFLDDIPEALLLGRSTSRSGRSGRAWRGRPFDGAWASGEGRRSQPAAPIVEPRFPPGARVRHPTWGEGVVLDSKIQDQDEIVDVAFESVGIKRLATSLANLVLL
jgi:DNA helicase-2/ATP-dependent DNA helicase PcrA